jgi:hypothetical protein
MIMAYAEMALVAAVINGLFESLFVVLLEEVSLLVLGHPKSPKFLISGSRTRKKSLLFETWQL